MNLETGLKAFLQPPARTWLEEAILSEYVNQRRWFASKDKAVKSIQLSDAELVALPNGEILLAEVEVSFDASIERYQLPLGIHFRSSETADIIEKYKLCDVNIGGRHAYLTDAFALDFVPLGLLAFMRDNVILELAEGQLRSSSMATLQEIEFEGDPKVRHLAAEQSNSSLVIGDRIIMKLVRRVMNGMNPEVEMVRYLTTQAYDNTPALLGEVQRAGSGGDVSSIILAQEFVRNQGDAWDYTLKFLRDRTSDFANYATFVSTVGTRLAQLHSVLARPTPDAAFSPIAASAFDVGHWTEGVIQQLQRAFQLLSQIGSLPVPAFQDRDFVLSHRQAVLSAVPVLAAAGIGSLMTRVHGDFHLGQVLVAGDDVYIIDFEGEPSKPLEVRRSKASPMRDVAGLLRSLHYAGATSGVLQVDFFRQMSASFLSAYRGVERSATPRWLKDDAQETALLDLFLLEKSAYEICYEAANRPTWVEIPLRGLTEIMARVLCIEEGALDA